MGGFFILDRFLASAERDLHRTNDQETRLVLRRRVAQMLLVAEQTVHSINSFPEVYMTPAQLCEKQAALAGIELMTGRLVEFKEELSNVDYA
ncbi:MAG: hypothetical protein AAFY84_09895 [Pseudomonadota bacterium]